MKFSKRIPKKDGYYFAKNNNHMFIVKMFKQKVYFTGIGHGVEPCVFIYDGGRFGTRIDTDF